ncbi:MAG: sulfite exporter TauE/SafE family protein [Candidatus Omnitrophica bacterium]|nr:sulfite exporter TauE/SafE family protein [Candidatus Omnitrophota bacterium]MBU0878118.1 sulfite exporter TauE/SafE family protein [Candidatus Omnitrophota bacterium]MBU0896964.1 sulfite exporter TauE/SafE family protein [Candidatus Omnitrophota bacterium]MBU1811161.1 sulfite exporter TauE/SafE family protein [Candidatus Omnitrophota bacterium]
MFEQVLINLEKAFVVSPIFGLGASFLAGILSSFSPCIYPLIPITLSVVGAVSATSRMKGFFISSIFVLGICFTYTLLGLTASVLGVLLGIFLVNPFTYLILVIILILLGLSLFGIIRLNIPFFSPQYNYKRGGFSLFILGMVSGLAIIPCNFPVLGAILSLIALKRNIFYGGLSLFFFSLGFGLILIILGTFTSLVRKLPKGGFWLITIKKGLGAILILTGVYFFFKFITLIK